MASSELRKEKSRKDKSRSRSRHRDRGNKHSKYRERSRSRSRSSNDRRKYRERDDKHRRNRKSREKYSRSPSSSSSSSSYSSTTERRKKRKDRHNKHRSRSPVSPKYNKRKYRDEVDELKRIEINKKKEMEIKKKQEADKKEKEEMRLKEAQKKPKEKELTEEEKAEVQRKVKLARARLVVMLENEEEKKADELLNERNVDDDLMIKEDNAMKDNERGNVYKDDQSDMSMINDEDMGNSVTTINANGVKMDDNQYQYSTRESKEKINDKEKIVGESKESNIEPDDEIDPLDAYMNDIKKEAAMQDYEIVEQMQKNQLQKRYNELVENDDDVKMIERDNEHENNDEEDQLDRTKVITLDDILNGNFAEDADQEDIDVNEEEGIFGSLISLDDEEFHKNFINTIKQNIPEQNEEEDKNKAIVLYEEDANELLKEEDFVDIEEAWLKAKKMGERKELPLVNHDLINYEQFRKNLYIEAKEIQNMTKEDVEQFRIENGDIKVRGKNIPKPVFSWYQTGLSDRILHVLEKKQFKKPFPIQAQAMPCIMSGRDVIGIAETGSGKTLAYVLPMLRHILDQRPLKPGEGPIGLIMVPTRELAFQIYAETNAFCKALGIRCCCVYGGAALGTQLSELKRGAEVIVCTPGRMIDVLCLSNGKITNLKRVTYVVIDEADRLFDLGFEPQISRILANIRPNRQTVMFSATFPRQIEGLAKKILIKPIEIVVGTRGRAATNVKQYVEVIEENKKLLRLLDILGKFSQTNCLILIFVDKQSEADELFKELYKLGYPSLVIHGGQDQEDRDFSISDFKAGVRNILIATSVCARGLDVKNLDLVINFKCPNHLEDYVHRVGRTGRAGNIGHAYTFISPEEGHLAEDIIKALELSNQIIPDDLRKLNREYKGKVLSGAVEKYKSSGFFGKGYKFSESEKEKVIEARKGMRKSYGMQTESDEEDDIVLRGGKNDEANKDNSQALALKTNEGSRRLLQLFRDPKAKQLAMDAGMISAKNAIIAGKTEEEALNIAQETIERVLNEYKPTVSAQKGAEIAEKIIEEWVDRENAKNNIFSTELEINDYPPPARHKATSKEFNNNMYEMTGCNVTVRGVYVEPGRKAPFGHKRLQLYITGSSRGEVVNAFREAKRVLDESALNYYTKGSAGFGQSLGKYQI